MVKSPLRYPGGKSKALDMIIPLIPDDFLEYREPFLGGGSVFIAVKQAFPDRKFWINDLYKNLYSFWDELSKNSDDLIETIQKIFDESDDGKSLHDRMVKIGNDDPGAAAAFYVLNRITFSGTTLSGGYSPSAFSSRFTQSGIDRLSGVSKLMRDTTITNLDYSHLLIDDPGVFMFLDPPYWSATKSALYGNKGDLHKQFDHRLFSENIKKCKCRWLITYDDSDEIRRLFNGFYITQWQMDYGMRRNNRNGNELFISNYKPDVNTLW